MTPAARTTNLLVRKIGDRIFGSFHSEIVAASNPFRVK
jgi:hypothetical protein